MILYRVLKFMLKDIFDKYLYVWMIRYQQEHPPFLLFLFLSCSSLRVLESPSLFGAFPSYLSLSRSRAFLALDPSSAFFYIYYYRIKAF